MIRLSNEDIKHNHEKYLQAYKSASASFLESAYIKKTFPLLESESNRTYPYQVKLPKSLPELLHGDFEPSKIITVNEPFQGLYSNIWFGDASSRCTLRCGYVDGNSSKLCQQTIGAEDIHMVLGGATGQGKSVTLNSIIFGFCMEFAPWEVDLTLCDAKIVEFKSYALQHPLPHIRRIAATEDADYIISVLDTLRAEMQLWNSIFPIAGVKKIDDFRKKTGLCIPQHIIVIDEFQTLFKNAKKKLNTILDIITAFAKLGRSTGFHLLLASQELGSDIPKDVLANISIRAAMGCDANVSEMILGNDEAKYNKGKRGKLIINRETAKGKEANVQIRVPFMPDDERLALGQNIIDNANKIGYSTVLSFYDAEASIDEKEYANYLRQFDASNLRLLLGEPSYVKEGEQIVPLNFNGKEMENLLVLTPTLSNQERYFKMLKENVKRYPKLQHMVISLSEVFTENCNAQEIASNNMFSDKKSFDNDVLDMSFTLIARRKLCVAIDRLIFNNDNLNGNETDFYFKFEKGSDFDTELNRKRFAAGLYLLGNDTDLIKSFGLDKISITEERVKKIINTVAVAITTTNLYGCGNTMLDKTKLPPIFVWLLGMNRMIGLGRDTRNQNVQIFKKWLQDCTEYGIRYIIFTNTMEDVTDLRGGLRWAIVDNASAKDLATLRIADDFPDMVSSNLGVLVDLLAVNDKCIKFKKMRLENEIFS